MPFVIDKTVFKGVQGEFGFFGVGCIAGRRRPPGSGSLRLCLLVPHAGISRPWCGEGRGAEAARGGQHPASPGRAPCCQGPGTLGFWAHIPGRGRDQRGPRLHVCGPGFRPSSLNSSNRADWARAGRELLLPTRQAFVPEPGVWAQKEERHFLAPSEKLRTM